MIVSNNAVRLIERKQVVNTSQNTCFQFRECNLFVPNVFSPNADGTNDVFFVSSKCVEEIDFTIYNRWGEMIFKSNSILEGWNGMYNDHPVPDGVYFYLVKYKFLDAVKYEEVIGHVPLLR